MLWSVDASAQDSACASTPDYLDAAASAAQAELCNRIFVLKLEAEKKAAEAAARAAGLDVSTDMLPEGTATLQGDDGLPVILSNHSLKQAATAIASDIKAELNATTSPRILIGSPSDHAEDLAVLLDLEDQADDTALMLTVVGERVSRLRGFLDIASRQINAEDSGAGFTVSSTPSTTASTATASLLLPGAAEILALANGVDVLSQIVRSDVTVTSQTVTPSDTAAIAAVVGVLSRDGYKLVNPGQSAVADPASDAARSLTAKIRQPSALFAPLKARLAEQAGRAAELEAYLKSPSAQSSLNDAQRTTLLTAVGAARTSLAGLESRADTLHKTFQTSLRSRRANAADGPTAHARALRAIHIRNELKEAPHWLDVKVVHGAGASIISKGLFRSDRIHYSGSSLVEYTLMDSKGVILRAGLQHGNTSIKINDREGFKVELDTPKP